MNVYGDQEKEKEERIKWKKKGAAFWMHIWWNTGHSHIQSLLITGYFQASGNAEFPCFRIAPPNLPSSSIGNELWDSFCANRDFDREVKRQ
jgi:hypothetical protein